MNENPVLPYYFEYVSLNDNGCVFVDAYAQEFRANSHHFG